MVGAECAGWNEGQLPAQMLRTALGIFMEFSIECILSTWQILTCCVSECSLQPGKVPVLKKKHMAKHTRGWVLVLFADNYIISEAPGSALAACLAAVGGRGAAPSRQSCQIPSSPHHHSAPFSQMDVLQDCLSSGHQNWGMCLSLSFGVWRWG